MTALPQAGAGTLPASIALGAGRVAELDGLRGVAILLVVLWHYVGGAIPTIPGTLPAYLLLPLSLTYTGVNLFFVLSGFLIGGILLDNRESTRYFRTFYIRRFFRIIPLYYIVLLIVLALFIVRTFLNPGTSFSLGSLEPFVTYFAFVQNVSMAMHGVPTNVLSHTWSLAVEEQFYLTLPLAVWLLPRRGLVALAIAMIVATPWLRSWTSSSGSVIWNFDALYLGVLLAVVFRTPWAWERLVVRRPIGPILVAAGLVVMALTSVRVLRFGDWLLTIVALCYASALLAVLLQQAPWLNRGLRWGPLRQLGIMCFGVYLIHLPALMLSYAAIGRDAQYPTLVDGPSLVASGVALIVTVSLAWASWQWLEKPMIQRGHQWRYGVSPEPVSVPVGASGTLSEA